MKKKYLFVSILFLFCAFSCSTRFLSPGFEKFNEATDLIGKNIIYSFEKLQEEEMALRVAEAVTRDSIKPADLEPRVLTFEHLETRKELIKYLTGYSELLISVFEDDEQEDIQKNARTAGKNLLKISKKHENFLTGNEIGIMAAISAAIPEALTSGKRRATLLRIMNQVQPLLEKICSKLKTGMEDSRVMIDNFYQRQFILAIVEKWPEKESSREKYAKNGVKMLTSRNKINIILTDVIRAIEVIPRVHQDLRKSLKAHGNPVRALRDLVDYAYRIKELYGEFSD